MTEDYTPKRRDVLKTSGAALAAATVAGCLDGEDSEYETEAQSRIQTAINSVDPKLAAESNYVVVGTNGPRVHTQGEGNLNNQHFMIVDALTNEDFNQYVSGGQFDKENYGEATGSELTDFHNNINTQLDAALQEELEGFEESYGFRPSIDDSRRPKASPVMAGTQVRFKGKEGTTLISNDAMPLETDQIWDELRVSVDQDEGFFDGLL